ncbi:hypothetical protein NASALF_085 [Candidatus Nasuia deltocephalinicola str. NAS-ALF]|uniref:Uncharacterized protein n=1 Tax=Candidatus Nasuia deltocephalinicola str. NAS-ALF TaxID=1343077 RepID=S5TEX7_9PROT|nr:hypothetical protein NASALF_085 [Candidatus Nasuia deltocephalinicola str. NAS-ALF]
MYKCLKFFKKIFLNFKNIIFSHKMKNIFKKTPKTLISRYIKNLYFNKKEDNLQDLKSCKKFLIFKLKHFFFKNNNIKIDV